MILTTVFSLLALGQATLPGSNISMGEAQEKALIIVVAEPEAFSSLFGVEASCFGSVDLKQSAVLKGKPNEAFWKKASIGGSGNEEMPMIGIEYIFFLYDYKGHAQVHKVMANTDKNLEAVKAEIKAKQTKP